MSTPPFVPPSVPPSVPPVATPVETPVAPPFALLGIDHVVLRVRDVDRALRFYTAVIGGQVDRVQDALGLVQVRAGRSLIDLVGIDGPLGRAGGAAAGAQGRNVDHFCLRIEPFDATAIAAHLRAHGVDFEPPAARYGADGTGPSIYLQDPDGNRVELKGPPG